MTYVGSKIEMTFSSSSSSSSNSSSSSSILLWSQASTIDHPMHSQLYYPDTSSYSSSTSSSSSTSFYTHIPSSLLPLGPDAVQRAIQDLTLPSTSSSSSSFVNNECFLIDTYELCMNTPTDTASSAASVLGIDVSSIVKSLSFISSSNEPILVLLPGDKKVDMNKLTQWVETSSSSIKDKNHHNPSIPNAFLSSLNITSDATIIKTANKNKKNKMRLATLEECISIFGYTPGTFPPIGLRNSSIRVCISPIVEKNSIKLPNLVEKINKQLSQSSSQIKGNISSILSSSSSSSSSSTISTTTSSLMYVFAGGGSVQHMLAITWNELLRMTKAEIADITISSSSSSSSTSFPSSTSSTSFPLSSLPYSQKEEDEDEEENKEETLSFTTNIQSNIVDTTTSSVILKNSDAAINYNKEEEEEVEFIIPPPSFLVDGMLGRLVRWLRVIGVDAESASFELKPNHMTRNELSSSSSSSSTIRTYHRSLIEKANAENRILLTRDKKLLQRKEPCMIKFLNSNDTRDQFEQVCGSSGFNIRVKPEDLMSRCSKCNGLGYIHMKAEQVVEELSINPMAYDVPAKVLTKIDDFWRCRVCNKLYWEGDRLAETREAFWALFDETTST